jgi:protein-L-isoaspartate(D-aspartate) O-methyltransferase
MVIPVGQPGGVQQLTVVEKRLDGSVSSRSILMVVFVPLTRSQS